MTLFFLLFLTIWKINGFFQILVWKVVPQYDAPSLTSPVEDHIDQSSSFSNHARFHYQQFEAVHMCKLAGHEGSIFRITWSSDGSKLVSVSDDRRWISFLNNTILIVPYLRGVTLHNNWFLDLCSARIWAVHTERNGSDKPGNSIDPELDSLVLFGHNARVWDCCISDSVSFTKSLFIYCFFFFNNLRQKKIVYWHQLFWIKNFILCGFLIFFSIWKLFICVKLLNE